MPRKLEIYMLLAVLL